MKKLLLFVLVVLFGSLLMNGCMGDDGDDGRAYLSFDWDWYVDSYWDNNPNVPYSISKNRDYNVKAGTYSFSYNCSDGVGNFWGYDGTYRITINKGEAGKAFGVDGADGNDKYFNLFLSGNGAYYLKPLIDDKIEKEILLKNQIDLSFYNKVKVGEPEEFVYYSSDGWAKLVIVKQCYILVEK